MRFWREQSFDQCFDMRIYQRFAATDGDHRRIALIRRSQTVLQAHHVLERGGVFADPAAARAREVAGMQRFKLKHGGEFLRTAQLMPDYIGGDFGCERKWKSHKSVDFNESRSGCQ